MSNHGRRGTPSEKLRGDKPFFRFKNLVLIICLLLTILSLYQIKPVSSAILDVPDSYATIQEAVDNAADGDTIHVASGIYREHVVVGKSLAIEGEDPKTTIVDGTANGTVFFLEGSNVNITGFTIRNAGSNYSAIESWRNETTSDYHFIANNIISTSQYSVLLSLSDHNTISNNTIETNQYGVCVINSTQNTIFNNTFTNNSFGGIYFSDDANNNNITRNTITDGAYGIKFVGSLDNVIEGNTISKTSYAIHLTASSTENTIRHNIISGKTVGVYSSSDSTTVHHNTIMEGAYGIYFYNCRYGSVYYNTFKNNSYGMRLYMPSPTTSSHTITNNKLVDNDWAIELVYAYGNTFTGNWLQQNTYGIYMTSSSANSIYRNNFVHNSMQAYSGTGTNSWDNGAEGNYWSDYEGEDGNPSDGIGDTPYRIMPVGYDNYPLITTWSEHDIEIQNVTTSTNEASPDEEINITVTVKNRANTSVSETFTVTAKYDLTVIGTQTVTGLAQNATETLTFNWNITGVASGNYTINAEASTVPDELNSDNNNFIDGTVKISAPLVGDINADGIINNDDLILLNQAFGSTPTSGGNWNLEADLNKDDLIDVSDLYLLGENFGKTA